MAGQPVWLASISLRDRRGEIMATATWSKAHWRYAEATLRTAALAGVGDESRERLFRMCLTGCLHRGMRAAEVRSLPDWWHAAPAVDIAGGPVEVLWSKGIPDTPSARPCARPGREPVDPSGRRPDLWLPVDCGECLTCLARKEVRR